MPDTLKACLSLEAIGDNQEAFRSQPAVPKQFRMPSRRPWVARILAEDWRFGFKREFLDAQYDYSQANSVGSRGVMMHFVLDAGELYEVKQKTSWSSSRRYFCTVRQGEIVELTKEEVYAVLEDRERNKHH